MNRVRVPYRYEESGVGSDALLIGVTLWGKFPFVDRGSGNSSTSVVAAEGGNGEGGRHLTPKSCASRLAFSINRMECPYKYLAGDRDPVRYIMWSSINTPIPGESLSLTRQSSLMLLCISETVPCFL